MAEFILYAIILLWALSRYYWYFELPDTVLVAEYSAAEFKEYDAILRAEFPYYQKLSDEGKSYFIGRLKFAMDKVPLAGREGMEITPRVTVLIIACLTQLTYGFAKPHIPFLKGVIVYPEPFYSKILQAWVKGLSMGNGLVLLSYQHFVEGYQDTRDTYNLGLHEFAHVLRFQANEYGLFDERLSAYFSEWEEAGYPVFMETRSRQQDFFREYGGTNSSEFFSVCVENFFEVPDLFRAELPELYYHLCFLLKQDPLNTAGDYAFDEQEVRAVNQTYALHLPVYKLWNSQHELIMLESVDTLVAVFGIVAVACFIGASEEHRWVAFRLLAAVSFIFCAVRTYYYRNIRSVLNKRYLSYFLFKLAPLLALITIVYAAGISVE
jgi:MtfA peptidase